MADGHVILVVAALLALAVLVTLLAGRIRVPALVAFLAIGMLIGSDGVGWFEFSDYELAGDVGIIALVLIIAEGGLSTGFDRIRPVLSPAIALAIGGTILTAALTGFGAALVFDFSLLECMLLGAIVASTDAAAVFAVLRNSTLTDRLARSLEGEAALNDPVAILLVLGFIEWLDDPAYGAVDMIAGLIAKLAIGAVVGGLLAYGAVRLFQRMRLDTNGLYPVASLASVGIAYGLGEVLGGSGFAAVYLVALGLGSAQIPARRIMIGFHEGLGWVAQIALFLTLGLLVFPEQLPGAAPEGMLLGLILAFVARPLAVWVTTLPFSYTRAERTVLAWAGLRGAVPVVLATFAVLAGTENSGEFFNIVFFTVIFSTLVQGTTFEALAERLGVTTNEPVLPRPLAETGTIRRLGAEIVEYPVGPEDAIVGHRVRDLQLPREALINVIVREGRAVPPRGSTRLAAGDELHILVRDEESRALESLLVRWRTGPIGPPERPRRSYRGAAPVFTVRRWREDDGDASRPARIDGIPVHERLRARHDVPGALLALGDGRFAVSGPRLVLGSADQVEWHARRRIRLTDDELERSWWQDVIAALSSERTHRPHPAR